MNFKEFQTTEAVYVYIRFLLVDHVGENFIVNLKCNDTGRRRLDVCMNFKLIKYGISGSRGSGGCALSLVTIQSLTELMQKGLKHQVCI